MGNQRLYRRATWDELARLARALESGSCASPKALRAKGRAILAILLCSTPCAEADYAAGGRTVAELRALFQEPAAVAANV